jgi:hypothetical protein
MENDPTPSSREESEQRDYQTHHSNSRRDTRPHKRLRRGAGGLPCNLLLRQPILLAEPALYPDDSHAMQIHQLLTHLINRVTVFRAPRLDICERVHDASKSTSRLTAYRRPLANFGLIAFTHLFIQRHQGADHVLQLRHAHFEDFRTLLFLCPQQTKRLDLSGEMRVSRSSDGKSDSQLGKGRRNRDDVVVSELWKRPQEVQVSIHINCLPSLCVLFDCNQNTEQHSDLPGEMSESHKCSRPLPKLKATQLIDVQSSRYCDRNSQSDDRSKGLHPCRPALCIQRKKNLPWRDGCDCNRR